MADSNKANSDIGFLIVMLFAVVIMLSAMILSLKGKSDRQEYWIRDLQKRIAVQEQRR